MDAPLLGKKYYTFEDWCSLELDEGVRAELVDGTLIVMEGPTWRHQAVVGELLGQLMNFLKGKPCVAMPGPGVRLNEHEDTGFVPDLIVVCDRDKFGKRYVHGAPDLIVEVLSPSNRRHDTLTKFNKYQRAGVREYWIVDLEEKTVQVCILEDGKYILSAYGDTDAVPVHVLEGCAIDLRDVFPEEAAEG